MADARKAGRVVPVATLHFGEGSQAGRTIRLDAEEGLLGRREDNTYVVPDPRVSRVHARIRRIGSAVLVEDLDSSAGTTVNGERITGPASLSHGDRVGFGPVIATFHDPLVASTDADDTLVLSMSKVLEDMESPQLSPRQLEVLRGMADGRTNGQIGEALGVTERTVKAYAQEIFDKLGTRNRAGAVAEASRLGLL